MAFFVVGLPGLLLAILVRSLKEPSRGISEGLMVENHPYPFSVLKTEVVNDTVCKFVCLEKRGSFNLR